MTAQPVPEPAGLYVPLRPLDPTEQVPEPDPSRRTWRDRMPHWWLRAIAVALAVALLGTGFLAYRLSDDLTAARGTIASQRDQLTTTKAQLEAANTRGDQLTAQVASLQGQLQQTRDCVGALQAATERQIFEAQQAAYNLTAEGSVWAKATDARNAAMAAAVEDFRQVTIATLNGSYSTATTYLTRAGEQIAIANGNLAVMNVEVGKVNTIIDQIDGMLATAGTGLGVCGSGSSSSS